jgi:hypothetical protein
MKLHVLWILCVCCLISKLSHASDTGSLESQLRELSQIVKELKLTVENQQREIAALKGQTPPPLIASTGTPPIATRAIQGRWNPDIGAIADTVLKLDTPRGDAEGADRISVRELELVLGSAVDPYSRLDATISFSDFEEASLEEAYYTHFGLPWDITARLGRFKPGIGKALPVHRDSLDTIDEPLVIQRYFGLEGYNKSGVDIKKTLDLPWASIHQISLGILEGGNGEDGTLFGETRRRPTIYSHLKNYFDVNDTAGLELGASYLAGSKDPDTSFEVNVLGLDGTLIHRWADQRHLKLQGEAFHVSRKESFIERENEAAGEIFFEDLDNNRHLWGGYAILDFRFDPRWAAGFRFDDVQIVDNPIENPDSRDAGYTGYLTFYQSEFARWRAQFTHLDLANGQDDNQVMIQGTFSIGEHKHKL